MKRALFLDRDGVINHEVGWLHRVEDVRFVDGIFSLCRAAKELGYVIVVVTNQAGIGRGLYTVEDFERLTEWMLGEFRREGVELDAVYHSPFHPEHGIGEYRRDDEDRKPRPGMLLRARAAFGVELGESVIVGDRCTDVEAGLAAGVKRAFLLAGTEEAGCDGEYVGVGSLGEVEAWLRAAGD